MFLINKGISLSSIDTAYTAISIKVVPDIMLNPLSKEDINIIMNMFSYRLYEPKKI